MAFEGFNSKHENVGSIGVCFVVARYAFLFYYPNALCTLTVRLCFLPGIIIAPEGTGCHRAVDRRRLTLSGAVFSIPYPCIAF